MVLSFEAQIVLVLGMCIIFSYLLNLVAKLFKLPMMIAPLLVGLMLSYFGGFAISLFPAFRNIIEVFSSLGILLVLFFIGLKVDLHYLKDVSKDSTVMAVMAGIIPFVLGFIGTYIFTGDWVTSLFVGIALAITAEEVSIEILDELSMIQKRIGQKILDAGIIGDLFEISAIAIVGALVRSITFQGGTVLKFLFDMVIFVLIILLMRYFVIELLLRLVGKGKKKFEYSIVAMVTLFIIVASAELLNFSSIIGALLAGILLKNKLISDKLYIEEHHIVEALEVFNFGIFHPLIFIWIGLTINLTNLSTSFGFGIVLTALALLGKIIGCIIGSMINKENVKEGILIGWGLNARGATEMFALLIAQNMGFISKNIFSSVVVMVLLTTIISPIVFEKLAQKGFGIVDHNIADRLVNLKGKKSPLKS